MDKIDLSGFSLEGRTAIITGGSGGIGRACAAAFAKAGANIVIASLPPDSIPPVIREVEGLRIGSRRFKRSASEVHGGPDAGKV